MQQQVTTDRSFCKIGVRLKANSDDLFPHFVTVLWNRDSFSMEVTDGKRVWVGEASRSYIEKNMLPRGGGTSSPFEPFLNLVRQALSAPTAGTERFRYFGKLLEGNVLELTWHMQLEKDDMLKASLRLSMIGDAKKEKERVQQFLSWLIEKETQNKAKALEHQRLHDALMEELEEARKALTNVTERQSDWEAQLYAKFVAILNTKKAKIRSMKAAPSSQSRAAQVEEEQEEASEREASAAAAAEPVPQEVQPEESLPLGDILAGKQASKQKAPKPLPRKRIRPEALPSSQSVSPPRSQQDGGAAPSPVKHRRQTHRPTAAVPVAAPSPANKKGSKSVSEDAFDLIKDM